MGWKGIDLWEKRFASLRLFSETLKDDVSVNGDHRCNSDLKVYLSILKCWMSVSIFLLWLVWIALVLNLTFWIS